MRTCQPQLRRCRGSRSGGRARCGLLLGLGRRRRRRGGSLLRCRGCRRRGGLTLPHRLVDRDRGLAFLLGRQPSLYLDPIGAKACCHEHDGRRRQQKRVLRFRTRPRGNGNERSRLRLGPLNRHRTLHRLNPDGFDVNGGELDRRRRHDRCGHLLRRNRRSGLRRRWQLNVVRRRCHHGGCSGGDSNRARRRRCRRGLFRGRLETPFRCGWRRRVHQLGPEAVDRVCLLGLRWDSGFGHGRGGGFGAGPRAERSQASRAALALSAWRSADRAEPGVVWLRFGNLRRPG